MTTLNLIIEYVQPTKVFNFVVMLNLCSQYLVLYSISIQHEYYQYLYSHSYCDTDCNNNN